MTDTISNVPYWKWTFDSDGVLQSPDSATAVSAVKDAAITDLFVFAHGWNNDSAAAESMFQAVFKLMATAAPASLGTVGFVGVFWPSIWFPDPPAAKAAQVAVDTAAGRPGAADAAVSGKDIAATLKKSFTDPAQRQAITAMGTLVDEGLEGVTKGATDSEQLARVDEFHANLKTVFGADDGMAEEDRGEAALMSVSKPKDAYAAIADGLGSSPDAGDDQGLADVFGKVFNGAKDALRAASYLEMKKRAGTVGAKGLGPLLATLHQPANSPATRVHLMGHSFGARLVSYCLAGVGSASASPVASITLIQGAFSHWAFADKNPWGDAGGAHAYRDRVHGPVLATFTPADWAVGIWYPKASFLARDDNQAEADSGPSRWGGMGSDGPQLVPGPNDPVTLSASGTDYGFEAGQFYRIDSSQVISDTSQSSFAGAHSDIRHPEVAWLPLAAAATTVD